MHHLVVNSIEILLAYLQEQLQNLEVKDQMENDNKVFYVHLSCCENLRYLSLFYF